MALKRGSDQLGRNTCQPRLPAGNPCDTIANQTDEAYGHDAFVSNMLDTALNWLAKKRTTHSGDAYLDQLEKNAIYLRESASACNLATAMYLYGGQPILQTDEQVMSFVSAQREVGQEMARLQLKFLRSGCGGCEIHARHEMWANYRQMRNQPNRDLYSRFAHFLEEKIKFPPNHASMAEISHVSPEPLGAG